MRLGLGLGLGTGGAPSVFDPASVAGLIEDLWAQPSLVTLSGAKVTQWTDRAGHADGSNATQGTDANRPTYDAAGINGRPAINFAASQQLVLAMNAVSANRTVFIVSKPDAATGANQVYVTTASGALYLMHQTSTSGKTGFYDGAFKEGTSVAGAQIVTYRLTAGTGTATVRINGSIIATVNHSSRAFGGTGQRIGSDTGVNVSQYKGMIGRISVFTGALSDANVQLVERGLGAYYGITVA